MERLRNPTKANARSKARLWIILESSLLTRPLATLSPKGEGLRGRIGTKLTASVLVRS
jgi:hypothetical protein